MKSLIPYLKIWCNNIKCKYNQKVSKPTFFSYNKINYVPLESNEVLGKCTRRGYDFIALETETPKVKYKIAYCFISDTNAIICDREDCLHNSDRLCERKEIWISKFIAVQEPIMWYCRCFSDKKISGHRDWMSLIGADGSPKHGGHLSDDESEKLHRENTINRSFRDHTRQKL